MRSALDQMGPDDEPLIQDAGSTDGSFYPATSGEVPDGVVFSGRLTAALVLADVHQNPRLQ
jgi:hypothetical protein